MHQVLAPTTGDLTEQADHLQRTAAVLHTRRRCAEAEALAGRAVSLLAAEPDAPQLGRVCHALAGTLDDLGDRGGAESLYRRAGAIFSTVPTGSAEDFMRIRCARGLATNLRLQQRAKEADAILVSALALAEQLLGPSDTDTLATMTALGRLWEGAGRLEEAEDIYRQALARSESATGDDLDGVAGMSAALAALLERRATIRG